MLVKLTNLSTEKSEFLTVNSDLKFEPKDKFMYLKYYEENRVELMKLEDFQKLTNEEDKSNLSFAFQVMDSKQKNDKCTQVEYRCLYDPCDNYFDD
jgi:hypothetical protein